MTIADKNKGVDKIYDKANIFAKILRGEIPCKKIYEDDLVFCFYDIKPEAKTHCLIIPKLEVIDFSHFVAIAGTQKVGEFFEKTKYIAEEILHLSPFGYRLKTNNGHGAGQEVFHFHLHLLSNN